MPSRWIGHFVQSVSGQFDHCPRQIRQTRSCELTKACQTAAWISGLPQRNHVQDFSLSRWQVEGSIPVRRLLALSSLLQFDNPPPDLPIRGGHNRVDGPGAKATRRVEKINHLREGNAIGLDARGSGFAFRGRQASSHFRSVGSGSWGNSEQSGGACPVGTFKLSRPCFSSCLRLYQFIIPLHCCVKRRVGGQGR